MELACDHPHCPVSTGKSGFHPHAGLSLSSKTRKDLVSLDATIVANLDRHRIDKRNPCTLSTMGHQAHKTAVANLLWKLTTQMPLDIVLIVAFEGAITGLMKMNADRHYLLMESLDFRFRCLNPFSSCRRSHLGSKY